MLKFHFTIFIPLPLIHAAASSFRRLAGGKFFYMQIFCWHSHARRPESEK